MSKLIECLHRRQDGTTVTFDANERWPAGKYVFKPILIGGGHAAQVDNAEHAERLLEFPKSYRLVSAQDEVAQVSVPSITSNTNQVVPPQNGDGNDDDAWDAVKAMGLPVAKILPLVSTWSHEQIRDAIDAEQAKSEPRETVVKRLVAALKGEAES